MEIMTEYERIREVVKDLDPEQCGLSLSNQIAICAEARYAGIVEIVQTAYLYGWVSGQANV